MKPSILPAFLRPASASRGMVLLVVTLSLVVLLTFVIVAFFAASTVNRTVENASSSAVGARTLAEGAVSAIEGELINEIVAGSTKNNAIPGVTLYYSTNATNMVPKRSVFVEADPSKLNYAQFVNVLKQSGKPLFSTNQNEAVFYFNTSNATDSPSSNGRKINPANWNAPMLTSDKFTGNAAGTAPKWIFVNTNGYSATANATTTPAPTIGRIAFNVYDVGGLLDINAAGYADGIPAATLALAVGSKGSPLWADLTKLPGINTTPSTSDLSWPPKWRVPGNWGSYISSNGSLDGSLAYGQRSGWMEPFSPSGGTGADRLFTSRQDLIRFAKANTSTFLDGTGLDGINGPNDILDALPYLTTFSRDLNQPSFAPKSNRPKVQGGLTGNTNTPNKDDDANPSFLEIRVQDAFTRMDGTQAIPGEPLVKKRFPLERLAQVTEGATAGSGSFIHKAFGLTRSSASDPWTYNATGTVSTSTIHWLKDIANQTREPNMLELLQAAIHWGSLGRGYYDKDADGQLETDEDPGYQAIQIMANIIDQYDSDSFPTAIEFDNKSFYGVEDLPYMQRFAGIPYRYLPQPDTNGLVGMFLVPEIWRLHSDKSGAPTATPSNLQFRIEEGESAIKIGKSNGSGWLYSSPYGSYIDLSTSPPISFPLSAGREPFLLSNGSSGGLNKPDNKFTGYCLGQVVNSNSSFTAPTANINNANGLKLVLEYLSPGGNWLPYQRWEIKSPSGATTIGIIASGGTGTYAQWKDPLASGAPNFNTINLASADPRTTRFGPQKRGMGSGPGSPGNDAPYNGTVRPSNSNDGYKFVNQPSPPGGWTLPSNEWHIGRGTQNKIGSGKSYYQDPDGIVRDGTSAYGNNNDGYPLVTGNQNSRPVILNRAFRNVAELGFVFRGQPWKNLDFFTKESGDSALLDVFTISEDKTPDAIVAGRVNLNTRQVSVIEALINRAAKSAGVEMTSTEVRNAATRLTQWTLTEPFENPGDMVGKPLSTTAYKGFCEELGTVGAVFSGEDAAIQSRREVVMRALAGSGTTRTWNMMVDIIAQSGKQTASGFMVDGEHRAWVHLAIDRLTGTVIDRQWSAAEQ